MQLSNSRFWIGCVRQLRIEFVRSKIYYSGATKYKNRSTENPYLELSTVMLWSCKTVRKFIVHQVSDEFVNVGEHVGKGDLNNAGP